MRFWWDNFLVSLVEQEVAYQAEHFLGSVRSTWSDNVIWWRGANPQKAATTGGVVEAIYGSLGWKWSGQIHDERVLDRKEVQGGLVHKGHHVVTSPAQGWAIQGSMEISRYETPKTPYARYPTPPTVITTQARRMPHDTARHDTATPHLP